MAVPREEIKQQSLAAYNQWCEQWREHAVIHSKFEMKSLKDFRFVGRGRPCVLVCNGYSFEEHITELKQAYDNGVDIFCCDKSLGHLIKHDIRPTYCMVCDANVDYELYMKEFENDLQDTILFNNVCGNPEWSEKGNWKDKYFFVNKDILKSELEFTKLSGCDNIIPAGTNVSNAMIVLMNLSDEKGRCNFFGYDKYLLLGFDYSWKLDGKYYAFNKTGDGKGNYMRHCFGWDKQGNYTYTSNNLLFSARWLKDYVTAFKLPVIQCSQEAVTGLKFGKFKDHVNYKENVSDSTICKELFNNIETYSKKLHQWKDQLAEINFKHEVGVLNTI